MHFRALLLSLPLSALSISFAMRAWSNQSLWDALALGGAGLGVLVWSWRAGLRSKVEKPRWYQFRAGAFLLCLIAALGAWWGLRVPAPMGSGPAGPAVDAKRFSRPWRTGPVALISMGDSVSTGFGAGKGLGYFELIRKNSDDVYPEMRGIELSAVLPEITVIRLATNSSNSLAHARDVDLLSPFEPGVFGIVCITTGGIDLIHPYGRGTPAEGAMYGAAFETAKPWIERFERRLEQMMETLRRKFPGGCAVFIATIYDPTDDVADIENAGPIFWLSAWQDARPIFYGFNDAIRRVALKYDHVHLVDVHRVMLGHGIHCRDRDNPYYCEHDPTYWYYANLEDPNQRGYDAIRRAFLNAIADALAPR